MALMSEFQLDSMPSFSTPPCHKHPAIPQNATRLDYSKARVNIPILTHLCTHNLPPQNQYFLRHFLSPPTSIPYIRLHWNSKFNIHIERSLTHALCVSSPRECALHAIGCVVIFRGLLDPTGKPPVCLPRKPRTPFWGVGFTG